jgi:hypothetical protein
VEVVNEVHLSSSYTNAVMNYIQTVDFADLLLLQAREIRFLIEMVPRKGQEERRLA